MVAIAPTESRKGHNLQVRQRAELHISEGTSWTVRALSESCEERNACRNGGGVHLHSVTIIIKVVVYKLLRANVGTYQLLRATVETEKPVATANSCWGLRAARSPKLRPS